MNVYCIKSIRLPLVYSIGKGFALYPQRAVAILARGLQWVRGGYTGGMTFEGNGDGGDHVPRHREIPHYHGDGVRILFVVSAVLLIVAQSTGADLPLSTFGTVIAAVVLVIAAGITNPAQFWIHWANTFLAIYGTLLFGTTAVSRYRAGASLFDSSFVYVEALALLSLIALYFTTRTVRGLHMREDYSR